MSTCLELKNVSVSFGETKALEAISFRIEEGEVFGFLGPSGAGKTTTIKLLTKQLRQNKGDIELFGQSISDLKTSIFESIGVMSDSNDIYGDLSVEDNLKFFAEIKSVDLKEVEPLLKRIGLFEHRKKLAKKLSNGMHQRLVLASAIIHKPKLLFLDEPTSALDPKTTAEIHELFIELNRSGTTIFLTTHSMAEADKLCHRIAFLDQGRIVELGSAEDLKLKYARDEIIVQYRDKGKQVFAKDGQGLEAIINNAKGDEIVTIHSNEPSLETIFLTVTGRDQYEIA